MQHQQYAEEQGLLGSLCPGQKKLEGKTFYLDSVKKRSTALLLETISLLGGGVESFLHKDVSFLVTGSQEYLKDLKCKDTKAGVKGTSGEAHHPVKTRESVLSKEKRQPGTPRPMVCGSRGKALLEKAIRNNEQLKKNSVLDNARSWGVKILYVDDVLLYLKQLTRESFSAKRPERAHTKHHGSPVVKAAALRSPYLKIEDLCRKYKPLHMQSMTFPTLWYRGRFSPFECPPPQFEKWTEQGEAKTREKKKVESSIQDKSQTPLSCNPSPWRPRKKDLSYCECCHQPFSNLEEHRQSDQHRAFVLDLSNYSAVDQLVVEMLPGFNPNPPQQSEETLARPPTPLPIQDACELQHLTDAETEHAVQALRRQGSSFSIHVSSPSKGPLASAPGSPSTGFQSPIPNPATPPPDIQPFNTDTDCQVSDHPRASSPVMPVLDAELRAHDSTNQQPDAQHLSPCPDKPCPSSDPYLLPPVLSPQVPCPSYIKEPHSPYSEPPVLSPQQYAAEEAEGGHSCEMDTAGSAFQFALTVKIPLSTPHLPSVASPNAEEVTGSNQHSIFGFNEVMCSNVSESPTLFSSCSLPETNPKKRCRSGSPEHSWTKRRRITEKCVYSDWSGQTAEPERGIVVKPEYCSLYDEASFLTLQSCSNLKNSPTYTVETHGSKQTFPMFCVPTVQNVAQVPHRMDISGHGSTSVAGQPPWPLSSKTFNPPCQLPNSQSPSAFSTEESQRSQSHSTSVCIESALIPDLAVLSPSSSDSDWDCDLLSRLGTTSEAPLLPTEQSCELDKELLHRPCTWMQDTSYESRLHTALQPSAPGTSLCAEEMDPSAFSRTVVPIVEVQH